MIGCIQVGGGHIFLETLLAGGRRSGLGWPAPSDHLGNLQSTERSRYDCTLSCLEKIPAL
jgi:hypothetical protein